MIRDISDVDTKNYLLESLLLKKNIISVFQVKLNIILNVNLIFQYSFYNFLRIEI